VIFFGADLQNTHFQTFQKGSDYEYAWPDAIPIKGSVCHSNSVDLVA